MNILSKDTVVIAAPSQNRPNFENSIERSLPLLAAREINDIKGACHTPIELWNCVGSKIDNLYIDDHLPGESRAEYSQRLLRERYDFMQSTGLIDDTQTNVITDDEKQFVEWTKDKITDYADSGKIYESDEVMSVCDLCGTSVSVHTNTHTRLSCPVCKEDSIHPEKRKAWFMNIDNTAPNIVLPRKSKHLASQAINISERVWIERRRMYGTELDAIDSDYCLDPKLALSLMPAYIADSLGINQFVFIQGRETLYNTAPYIQTFSPEIQTAYVLPAHVPRGIDKEWLDMYSLDFAKRYLPLFALDRTTDVSESQVADLKREYDSAIAYITKMRTSGTMQDVSDNDIQALKENLDQTMDLISQCRIRDSVVKFRRAVVGTMGSGGLFNHPVDNPAVSHAFKMVGGIYGPAK